MMEMVRFDDHRLFHVIRPDGTTPWQPNRTYCGHHGYKVEGILERRDEDQVPGAQKCKTCVNYAQPKNIKEAIRYQRVLPAVTNEWQTTEEVGRRAGIASYGVRQYLAQLEREGAVIGRFLGEHWQAKSWRLPLAAGSENGP